MEDQEKQKEDWNHQKWKMEYDLQDEDDLFKEFYKKGTFDHNSDFQKEKHKFSAFDDDDFFDDYKKNRTRVETMRESPYDHVKTSEYGKTVSVETVTENGKTRKITRTKIKHPDGRVEEHVEESNVNELGFDDDFNKRPGQIQSES